MMIIHLLYMIGKVIVKFVHQILIKLKLMELHGKIMKNLLLLVINILNFGKLMVVMFKEKWDNNKENLIHNFLLFMHLMQSYQVVVVEQFIYGKVQVVIKVLKHMKVKFVHLYLINKRNYYILVVWMVK